MRSLAQLLLRLSSLVDALVVAVIFSVVWTPDFHRPIPDFLVVLLVVPFWMFLLRFFGLYESHRLDDMAALARKVLSVQVTGFLVLAISLWLLGVRESLTSVVLFVALCTGVMITERWIVYVTLRVLRRQGFDERRVLVVSDWEKARSMARRFSEHPDWGLSVACVGVGAGAERQYLAYPSGRLLDTSLENVLGTQVIDEVLIAVAPEAMPQENETVHLCEQYGVLGRVLLDKHQRQSDPYRLENFCGDLSIAVGGVPCRDFALFLKRVMDFALALALIVLLAPFLLALALLVKLSSPGPLIFRQTRVGLRGRKFTLYKYRTMVNGAEALLPSLASKSTMRGPVFKDPSDSRITEIGRVLRKFSIDELPQLFNVLKGDMSLVGPRPLPVHESAAIAGEYRRRFSMRPGITCLWQVNGRSGVEYTRWMSYDLQYVDGWSLWLDAKLLVQTIPAVLSGKGAC